MHFLYTHALLKGKAGNRWVLILIGNASSNYWGQRTIYNRQTGAYTFMQDNVGGTWSETLNLSRQRYLDKDKRLMMNAEIGENYQCGKDFAISYDGMPTELNKLTYIGVNGNLKLTYSYGKLSVGMDGAVKWSHSTSDRSGYINTNAWEYQYGATLNYTLPWNISLATDIKMYSRRGYAISNLNTNDLVWNGLLSRSFLKGKLTAKLQAFDILHQLSNISYQVTLQGHRETWNKCFPRYVMFSLGWKFNKNPKKK